MFVQQKVRVKKREDQRPRQFFQIQGLGSGIGNKGTWSTAHVDVAPHAGDSLFTENFDNYSPNSAVYNPHADFSSKGWVSQNSVANEVVAYGINNVNGTDGFWYDTQGTSGGVDIKTTFTDTNGGKDQLTFDVAVQNFHSGDGRDLATLDDPNASFQFKVDGQAVATVTAQEIFDQVGNGNMMHFDVKFDVAAGDHHTFELVDLSHPGDVGFAIDNIQVHDWIV